MWGGIGVREIIMLCWAAAVCRLHTITCKVFTEMHIQQEKDSNYGDIMKINLPLENLVSRNRRGAISPNLEDTQIFKEELFFSTYLFDRITAQL